MFSSQRHIHTDLYFKKENMQQKEVNKALCPHERFNNVLLISDFFEQRGKCTELMYFSNHCMLSDQNRASLFMSLFHKQTTARKTYIAHTVTCLSDLIRLRQQTVLYSYLFLLLSHWSSEGQQNYKWQLWRSPRKLSDQLITGRCFTSRAPAPR